MKEKGTKKRGK
jgi:hypothetical protein